MTLTFTTNDAILNAIEILFQYNIFKFGDLIVQQTEGILMGSHLSLLLTTIYYGIREEACLLQDYNTNLLDYARFINDGIGLWDTSASPNPDLAWECFSTAVNAWGSLTWIISPLTTQVDFLGITFSLQNGHMNYTLYAKALNLYLYLPPHSAHPLGVLKGMVYGRMFFRFLKLIKNVQHQKRHLQSFFKWLVTVATPQPPLRRSSKMPKATWSIDANSSSAPPWLRETNKPVKESFCTFPSTPRPSLSPNPEVIPNCCPDAPGTGPSLGSPQPPRYTL
jgi:hypothetical protein